MKSVCLESNPSSDDGRVAETIPKVAVFCNEMGQPSATTKSPVLSSPDLPILAGVNSVPGGASI